MMDRRTAWLTAARPRTLPAAAAPVLVGGGLAGGDGTFRLGPFLAAMVGALAIQVAANFANDASDAARGADTPERIGPPRMVAEGIISPGRMWTAVWASVAVAAAAGVYLIAVAGWVIALIGIVSILAMLGYVGGPVPYGYRALGEVSVFVFFGLVATVGSRYVHDRAAPLDAWVLGVVMGLLASAILVANNLRDLETDAAADKRTLAVVLGRRRTRSLFATLMAAAFAIILVGAVTGLTPPASGMAIVLAPFAVPLVRTARQAVDGPSLVGVLSGVARLQLLVGIFVGAGSAV